MNTKLVTALIAVMTLFAFTAIASAGIGPGNPGHIAYGGTVNILYAYSSWDGECFITYPGICDDDNNSFTVPQNHTINVTVGNTIYTCNIIPVDGYLNGSYWSLPSAELTAYANSNYSNVSIIFFDMVNIYQDRPGASFATGAFNANESGKLLAAIRTGPTNNTCYMPNEFLIRDTGDFTYAYGPNGTIVATENTNLSANSSCYNTEYNQTFVTKFFKIHDSPASGAPGMMGVADDVHSDALLKLLVAQYKGQTHPTFSLNP